jgi:hypothetical protein
MNEVHTTPDPKTTQQQQLELQSAITLCLDMDRAFRLYSYRIISQEQFLSLVRDNAHSHLQTIQAL